jgi:hypothetical protein
MFASRAGNAFLIDFLIANKADKNAKDDQDWTVKPIILLVFPFTHSSSSLSFFEEPFTREQPR